MRSLPVLSILAALSISALAAPAAADETSRLHELFQRAWEEGLKENPLTATYVGRHEYDDRLPEATMATLERQAKGAQEYLDELGRIDRSKLSAEDQVSADIFRVQLEDALADWRLGAWQMPFN